MWKLDQKNHALLLRKTCVALTFAYATSTYTGPTYCSSYNCGTKPGWESVANAATKKCTPAKGCQPYDPDTCDKICCRRNCGDFKCPAPYKKTTTHVVCHSATATDLLANCTREECCPATCDTYICPPPFNVKPGAGSTKCQSATKCTAADQLTCCQKTCANYICKAGKQQKPQAVCAGASCLETECCESLCSGFTCPSGSIKQPGTIVCQGDCTKQECCHTTCESYSCPAQWSKKPMSTPPTACKDQKPPSACTKDECCQATCASYTCPRSWVAKQGHATSLCTDPKGCTVTDRDTCCERTCSSAYFLSGSCPSGYVPIGQAVVCKGNCSAAQCCKATCHSYTCPAGWHSNFSASAHLCKNPAACSEADDKKRCCEQVTCRKTNYQCSKGYTPVVGDPTCANGACTDAECCEATCASFTCPTTWGPLPGASSVLCGDATKCTMPDKLICCELTCSTAAFTCPTGSVLVGDPKTTECGNKGVGCTVADCCKQTCASYTCPPNWKAKADMATTVCSNPAMCTISDAETCCELTCESSNVTCPADFQKLTGPVVCQNKLNGCSSAECCKATCASYQCPLNWDPKPKGDMIPCANPLGCNDTDIQACCRLTCDGFVCPAHFTEVTNHVVCSNPRECTVGECCQATCSGVTCPTSYERKPGSDMIPCVNSIACGSKDTYTCCQRTCEGFTCPSHYVDTTHHVVCNDTVNGCTKDECCEATCATYTCPPPWQQKPTMDAVCSDPTRCTVVDNEICCSLTCDGFTCPQYHTPMVGHVTCAKPSIGCTKEECCKLTCDSFKCPSGFREKEGHVPCNDAVTGCTKEECCAFDPCTTSLRAPYATSTPGPATTDAPYVTITPTANPCAPVVAANKTNVMKLHSDSGAPKKKKFLTALMPEVPNQISSLIGMITAGAAVLGFSMLAFRWVQRYRAGEQAARTISCSRDAEASEDECSRRRMLLTRAEPIAVPQQDATPEHHLLANDPMRMSM